MFAAACCQPLAIPLHMRQTAWARHQWMGLSLSSLQNSACVAVLIMSNNLASLSACVYLAITTASVFAFIPQVLLPTASLGQCCLVASWRCWCGVSFRYSCPLALCRTPSSPCWAPYSSVLTLSMILTISFSVSFVLILLLSFMLFALYIFLLPLCCAV